MIFVYNELYKPAWRVETEKKSGKRLLKHFCCNTLDVDFVNEIAQSEVDTIKDCFDHIISENDELAWKNTTEIGFGSRSGAPFINKLGNEKSKYDRNVVFATLDMGRRIVLNIGTKKGRVYSHHYDKDTDSFSVVFSLNADQSGHPAFYIVTLDQNGDYVRYTFEIKYDVLLVNSTKYTSDRIQASLKNRPLIKTDDFTFTNLDGQSELFFPVFRPRRPAANVICCSQKRVNDCTKLMKDKYNYDPSNKRIVLHTPADSKELTKTIEFLHKCKVNYVTYYLPDIKEEEFTKSTIVNTIRKNYRASEFAHVSIMSRDGNIFHIY